MPNNKKQKYRKVIYHEIATIISISTNVNIEIIEFDVITK